MGALAVEREIQVLNSGEIIRKRRNQKGWTAPYLCERAAIDQSQLSRWENGEQLPSDRKARNVAEALVLDFDEIRPLLELERYKRKQAKLNTDFRDIIEKMGAIPGEVKATPATTSIPVLGVVPAGEPIEPTPQSLRDAEDFISLPSEVIGTTGNVFALRVTGDSMTGRVKDGDFVVVDPDAMPQNGDMAVVMIDREATLKTWRSVEGGILLESANPEIEARYVSEKAAQQLRVVGTVIMKIVKYR